MRRSIQITCLLFSFAAFSQGRSEHVTFQFENAELPTIFDSISVQTGYFFSYNSDLLPKGSLYTISADQTPIDQFLSKLLVGTNLKYSFFKDQVIINYELVEQKVKKKNLFNISGKVSDEHGNPLPGVNIFLDGTTIGTSSNADGTYLIDKIPPGYYDLVFSFIGYENAVYNLSEYNAGSRIQRHQMIPSISELDEVEVVAQKIVSDKNKWPIYFQHFQEDLLGTSRNSLYCSITNPEVINFSYNESSDNLIAFASEPIVIRNEAMAYEINYYLESYERSTNDLRYRGQIRFQNNYTDRNKFPKRQIRGERRSSYLGSWNHFKKSLLSNRLKKDGFRIYETKRLSNLNVNRLKEINESDILVFKGKHWELEFKNYLLVVYGREKESLNFLLDGNFSSVIYEKDIDENNRINREPGKQISLLKLLKGPVRLDLNGQVIDRFALTSYGYWSWERLANLVPLNYEPKLDNF